MGSTRPISRLFINFRSMQRLKPDVDIVLDILNAVVIAQPGSAFAQSLLRQYHERGGLSKRQLQGLMGKASRIVSITPAKLATLEAIIKKKPTKYRSDLPAQLPVQEKDESTGRMMEEILKKYPEHKRVLFFRSKYDNNEPLTAQELAELERFSKILK